MDDSSSEIAPGPTPVDQCESGSDNPRRSLRLLVWLTIGHGVEHFGRGGLILISPHIREALALSEVAFGGLATAQSAANGVANVPAGILTDMYRRRVAWLLGASMFLVGTGYLIVGVSPWYWLIIMSVSVIGFGTSLWHAPAFGTLAANYPERRGFALSTHLTGAQVGDTLSPIAIGAMLGGITIGFMSISWGGFEWRVVSALLFIPAAITGLAVVTRLKSAGDEAERNMTWSEYRSTAKRLLSNKLVLGIAAVGALRQAVHVSFFAFLVLYMTEELDYSPFVVGLHLALLTAAGIVSTPVMGIISDRYGRKPVIVVAMSLMALFIFLFLIFDSGLSMTAVIGILGLFFLSSLSIINAAAIDQVDKGSEGSGMALLFAGGAVVGAIAPIVAGFIYADEGFRGFVWFAGSLATAGAVLAALLPMKRPIRN
ncbi:MAG TPA: MFS transporter [Dehalococcoidia bacterium]|nr:MFS transporter [Dehalococcoidia bacterium]